MFGAVLRPDGSTRRSISRHQRRREDAGRESSARRRFHWRGRARCLHRATCGRGDPGEMECSAQPSQSGPVRVSEEQSRAASEDGPEHEPARSQKRSPAPIKLEAQYTVQYIAHAPLEPRAAVAEWDNGKLTVWTGTQRPFGVRDELMQAFHLPATKVRVIQPDMGSGYGGKHTGEAAIEAARLAKAAGKPVKVVWTRAGGIHVGLLPPRRTDRNQSRRAARWHARRVGTPQLQLRPAGHRTPYDVAEPTDSVSSVEVAAAPGFVSRAGRDGEPLRARVPHG